MQLVLIICVSVVCVDAVAFKYLDWNAQSCGVEASSSLIHHNPWLVYLEYYSVSGYIEPVRCAATLIGKRHLVTAAHCVKQASFGRLVARLGEYDLTTENECIGDVCADPVKRINIIEIAVHESYDGSNNKNDIAVLVLEEEAPYTDFIRPICLPTGLIESDVTFSSAGWGELIDTHIFSNIKKIVPLPYWSLQNCQNAYNKHKYKIPDKIICAGGEKGIDTCRGDSGGPLTLIKGRFELWGVTSLGYKNCGTEGIPGIYTSVKEHLEWILEVVLLTS